VCSKYLEHLCCLLSGKVVSCIYLFYDGTCVLTSFFLLSQLSGDLFLFKILIAQRSLLCYIDSFTIIFCSQAFVAILVA
jgi:hypothetical protein